MDETQVALLDAVLDHFVLPPKLPGNQIDPGDSLEKEVTKRLHDACKFMQCVEEGTIWSALEASLVGTQLLNQTPISKELVLAAFARVSKEDAVEWLVLHVVQQNAALLIHRDKSTRKVVFESFEASASTHAVLSTTHALQWDFPGRAVAIAADDFSNESFQDALAEFLEQASEVAFDRFAARASKRGKLVVESRDTPSPALITGMLMSYLEAMGSAVPVCTVRKRVRDDVVLGSSDRPWRRCPFWLILRVATQRIVWTSCSDNCDAARVYFKFLMCVVLASLLADCHETLHPERVLMLQAKLCRRLAKLETEQSAASGPLRQIYAKQFGKSRAFFEANLEEARKGIAARWDKHKIAITRVIPRLPTQVPESDLILALSNSGVKLNRLLGSKIDAPKRRVSLALPSMGEGTVNQVNMLAARCSSLIDVAYAAMSASKTRSSSPEVRCDKIAHEMVRYMDSVSSEYHGDAFLASKFLLNLFELWVEMDSIATAACPLLRKYHPVFVPEALDMLCVFTQHEMERLSRVQRYLAHRIDVCNSALGSIFSNPHKSTAFPESYIGSDEQHRYFDALRSEIDAASAKCHKKKIKELERLMMEYNKLTEAMDKETCRCTRDPNGNFSVSGCTKCWRMRSRKKLKIRVHEALLPTHKPHRAAVLFELGMPQYLAAYRDATWRLMMLGSKEHCRSHAVILLSDFDPLKKFWGGRDKNGALTLASSKKSFLQTHYRELRLPTTLDEILLPFGVVFAYYDCTSGVWASSICEPPWYHHLMGSWLPMAIPDPFATAALYMDSAEHPSSYEIAANQAICPSNMSSYEFTAYQRAAAGTTRRWLVLVMELGSSNLNLSSEATMKLFTRLSLQAGPLSQDGNTHILRKVHLIFKETSFCNSLENQIQLRLDGLVSGRRDIGCMSILTTLSMRLHYLCSSDFKPKSMCLIRKVRVLLSKWLVQLREEVRATGDGETARKAASIAFRASLLCRQTFEIYLYEGNEDDFGEEEAAQFFRASIALSENLIFSLNEIASDVRQLLMRDLSMAYSMREILGKWSRNFPLALESTINETWAEAGSASPRSFSEWRVLTDTYWAASIVAGTKMTAPRTIHYHILQGHLLVDGKPLGRMPLQMRESAGIRELFQGQHLLTRPSGLYGMEYQLVSNVHNHEVHFGYREGEVVIRAKFRGYLLEYVPREVFKSSSDTDLPSGLVDDCVHWLNLHTGELEMRRKPDIWLRRLGNWVLNVRKKTATRNRKTLSQGVSGQSTMQARHGTCLVEPRSRVGKHIMQIFEGFEDIDKLTIYQPRSQSGRLSVELKRLELRFFVNNQGVLQSDQLRSEIDPSQHIGALHGLESKLVLRSVENHRKKSIIVPIGAFSWDIKGMHVSVRIANEGTYALFTVDTVLGRLGCPPEPLLLYLKALIHALTAFPVPDELTERTGTEEAYHCLKSAHSHPWTVLNLLPKRTWSVLCSLSPRRRYYPEDMRCYQTVDWDSHLTATVQHEKFASVAETILKESSLLESFEKARGAENEADLEATSMSHLTLRGIIRRQIYERIESPCDTTILAQGSKEVTYVPRDREHASKESCRVYRAMKELLSESKLLPELADLGSIFEKLKVVDGFGGGLETPDVQMLLNTSLSGTLASYMQTFRRSAALTDHRLHLCLALFAFSENCDMRVVSWLVALAKHSLLQKIEPPHHKTFTDFQRLEKPKNRQLRKIITKNQESYAVRLSRLRKNKRSRNEKAIKSETYDAVV